MYVYKTNHKTLFIRINILFQISEKFPPFSYHIKIPPKITIKYAKSCTVKTTYTKIQLLKTHCTEL